MNCCRDDKKVLNCGKRKIMMLKRIKLILVFCISGIFMLPGERVYSQDPVYSKFTEESGLPGNDVYDALSAKSGLMWFATDNGVSCYDGHDFVNFDVSDGLSSNAIIRLYEDPYHRIWFLGYDGSLSYYADGAITKYPFNDTIKKYYPDNYLNKITVVGENALWIYPRVGGAGYIGPDGLLIYDPESIPRNVGACLLSFTDLGDDYSISILHPGVLKNPVVGDLVSVNGSYYLPVEYMKREFQRNYLKVDSAEYLVSFRNVVYYIRHNKVMLKRAFDDEVLSLYMDTDGQVWISIKYDRGVYRFRSPSLLGPSVHYFDNFTITSIEQDREEGYWLSTEGNGLFFIPTLDFLQFKVPGASRNANIMSFGISGKRLWFSTREKDLYSGDVFNGIISNIRKAHIGEPYDWIRKIVIDSEGYLWLSSTEYLKYDPAGFPAPPDTVVSSSFVGKADGDSVIIASSYFGIYHGDDLVLLQEPESLKRVYAVHQDKRKRFWFGTLYGLYLYDGSELKFMGDRHPALKERISCIDHMGDTLLVGTSSHGLVCLHDDLVYCHILEEIGGSRNAVKCILPQNDSILWVGSKNGLLKLTFNKDSIEPSVESYRQSDGLPSNEINDIVMQDDFIWLATGKGLVSFDPRKLNPHMIPPMIRLNSVQINNHDTLVLDEYILDHDQNELVFRFSGVSYRLGERIQYRYMLSDYNEEIIYTKNDWVGFPNLAPGTYTFYVNAGNMQGVWNEEPKMIHFTIRKHYTQTTWFRMLLILAFATIVVYLTIFYQKQRKIKEQARFDLASMEQKMFRSQMNPHFVFNSLLAIQGFMYQQNTRDAGRYLTSFAKLIRHTLYGSSDEHISLDKELEAMRYYLELQRLRFNENFDFEILVDDAISTDSIHIPPLFIQPFLENAIEHGLQHREEKGKLVLRLKENGYCLLVEIEDNGIGREKAMLMQKKRSRLHKSMGMEIIRKRVETLNKLNDRNKIEFEIIDLKDENNEARGTLVRICIPLKIK